MGLFSITSGRNLIRVTIKITVTMPSATPIIEWGRIMADTAVWKPYGNREDSPISAPAAIAAKRLPEKAEMKIVAYRLRPIFGLSSLFRAMNMIQGMNTPIIPRFRTFAPSAMRPPSPKRNACRTKIIDTEIKPAKGPKIRPMAAPPRR